MMRTIVAGLAGGLAMNLAMLLHVQNDWVWSKAVGDLNRVTLVMSLTNACLSSLPTSRTVKVRHLRSSCLCGSIN